MNDDGETGKPVANGRQCGETLMAVMLWRIDIGHINQKRNRRRIQ